MFSTMSTVDIIQSIGVAATILFSIIGIIQSGKANKKASESDDIAKKALSDSQKDYFPLVRFVGKIDIVSKSIKILRNEITFDFDKIIFDLYNNNICLEDENDELLCITAEIENCGNGIISGISISDFFVQSGNEVAIDISSQEELETLCFVQKNCEECFVLLPKEKATVNFIVTYNIMDRNNVESLDDVQMCMEDFFDNYDNIMVSMSLKMNSLNHTIYQQDFLMGTYLNGEIIRNSFSNIYSKESKNDK